MDGFHSTLAGVQMEQFTHNNMVPFFGSKIRQNTIDDRNSSLLERYTGVEKDVVPKSEQNNNNFVDIQQNSFYDNNTGYILQRDRMNEPVLHNNILPTEQIYVGPGTKNTDLEKPSGGFHQDQFRDFQIYKNVDELRVKTNPKETYDARNVDGIKEKLPGEIGEFKKNRVDTFYENEEDDLLATTGANLKERHRSCVDVKDTNRKDAVEYQGVPYKNVGNTKYGKLQDSKKHILDSFGERNVSSTRYGKGNNNDYGKKNILVYTNERDVTTTSTYEGNLTSYVKSMIAPFKDVFRKSNKEYFVKNPREFGAMQTTHPKKQTIYNPNDVAKTTIKETLIHDTHTGNLKGMEQTTIYDPNDVARTTIKETLIHDTQTGILNAHTKKSIVYDPNDIAKKTIRETIDNDDTTINMKGNSKQTIYNPNSIAKTTIKETTIDNDHMGIVSGLDNSDGYLTNKHDAKITNKQITSDNQYIGQPENENGDGYKNANFNAKLTNKQITSDNEHFGLANGDNDKMMSYDDVYNAVINNTKENTLVKSIPTLSGRKVSSSVESVNLTSIKEQPLISSEKNVSKIYQEPPSKNTIQLTTDKETLLEKNDRLDPDLLKQFHSNPYTHSLTNAV